MILTLVVKESLTEQQREDAFAGKDITITGSLECMFAHNDAITKMSEKVEMFENLIGMGLIDKESLEEIGYKS